MYYSLDEIWLDLDVVDKLIYFGMYMNNEAMNDIKFRIWIYRVGRFDYERNVNFGICRIDGKH